MMISVFKMMEVYIARRTREGKRKIASTRLKYKKHRQKEQIYDCVAIVCRRETLIHQVALVIFLHCLALQNNLW